MSTEPNELVETIDWKQKKPQIVEGEEREYLLKVREQGDQNPS